VLKEITPRPEVDGFRARWEIRNSGDAPMSCRFGVEWNLALFDGGVRRLEAGEETALDAAELPPADRLHLRIPLHGADLIWQQSEAAAVWARPVRAATQGEDGFHLTYQGLLLVFVTDLELAPGEVKRFAQEFRIERAI
jgi:hypothetical protein